MKLFHNNKEFIPILQSLRNKTPTDIRDRDTGGFYIIAYSTIEFPKDDVRSWHCLDGSDNIPLSLVDSSNDGGRYYAKFQSRAA